MRQLWMPGLLPFLAVLVGPARRAELGMYCAGKLTIFPCASSGTSKKGH